MNERTDDIRLEPEASAQFVRQLLDHKDTLQREVQRIEELLQRIAPGTPTGRKTKTRASLKANPSKAQATPLGFRFHNPERNAKLVALLNKEGIKHKTEKDGSIRYSPDYEARVEDMIVNLRNQAFKKWQTLSCPPSTVPQYRAYMKKHGIPFEEETMDGNVGFLIPRNYRPHTWDLGD